MQNKHLFSLEHITTHRVPTLGNTPPVNGNSSKGIELDAIQSMECSKHIHLCSRKTVQLAELWLGKVSSIRNSSNTISNERLYEELFFIVQYLALAGVERNNIIKYMIIHIEQLLANLRICCMQLSFDFQDWAVLKISVYLCASNLDFQATQIWFYNPSSEIGDICYFADLLCLAKWEC